MIYWVDSNVFIEANDGPYPFAVAPSFWKHIEKMLAAGAIRTSEMVYKELAGYGDDLSEWFKVRKQTGLCITAAKAVQNEFSAIANHVYSNYDAANSADFLKGADGWVIAHAIQTQGTVVSQESKYFPNAKKCRIPDVCNQFSVRCIGLFEMLKEQGAVF